MESLVSFCLCSKGQNEEHAQKQSWAWNDLESTKGQNASIACVRESELPEQV